MDLKELHYILNHWRGIMKVMEQDWQEGASKIGLTMAEQHILWILHFEKEATMTEIANIGLWDVSTVMQVVNRLKEKGLVESKKMPHDRRISYVSLTKEGEEKRYQSSLHSYRFFEYLKEKQNKDDNTKEFFLDLFNKQREFNEFFHGKTFIDWVDKTTSKI